MKMKEYYNLKDEFPINQVFHRLRPEKQAGQSEANMGKARNIFFVTKWVPEMTIRLTGSDQTFS